MAQTSFRRSRRADPKQPCAEEVVRAELARILESDSFVAPPRRRDMLSFLVEEMLAGRGDQIKAYTIGTSVLGRKEDFDPNTDPVVRLEARRLRHNLDSYYVSEGRHNPLRISIPRGGYLPVIIAQEADDSEGYERPVSPDMIPVDEKLKTPFSFSKMSRRGLLIAGVLFGLAAIVLVAWTVMGNVPGSNAPLESSVQRPRIVVFPLEASPENDSYRYLAAGIADHVVDNLRRFPDIRVFAPQFGQHVSPDQLNLSNFEYIVSGILRSENSAIEVSVRLVKTKTGEIIWSNTYSHLLEPGKVFAIQSQIASEIATALAQPYGVIRNQITERLADQFVPSMDDYECVLRAYEYRRTFSDDLAGPTTECLQKATSAEPRYAEAWAMLGFLYLDAVRFKRVAPAEYQDKLAAASSAASRAISLGAQNVTGLRTLSAIRFYQGKFEESERLVRLALRANPNDPETMAQLGWRISVRGNFEEGIPLLQSAIRLSLEPPGWYFWLIAIDRLLQNDGEGMLEAAQKSAIDGSAFSYSLVAMAYGLMGNEEGASAALERMNKVIPNYDPIEWAGRHQPTGEILAAISRALQKAGWRREVIQ